MNISKKLTLTFSLAMILSYFSMNCLADEPLFSTTPSNNTLLSMQCPSCSALSSKTFQLSLAMSNAIAGNCSNASVPNFPPTVLNSSATLYLSGAGLANYARIIPITNINCIRLSSSNTNTTPPISISIVDSKYVRTFPRILPLLTLS